MGGYCSEGEPCAVYTEKRVKTRKATKCNDCECDIPVGTEVVSESFLLDGSWYRHRTCDACEALVQFLWEFDAECLYRGQLVDWVREGLAPHEFLEGGEYEEYPRGCKPIDEWVDKAKKERDEAAADDAKTP